VHHRAEGLGDAVGRIAAPREAEGLGEQDVPAGGGVVGEAVDQGADAGTTCRGEGEQERDEPRSLPEGLVVQQSSPTSG
jgi:hypothetical protein